MLIGATVIHAGRPATVVDYYQLHVALRQRPGSAIYWTSISNITASPKRKPAGFACPAG